ncbi:hypothetical protein [Kribbella sp. NPDC049227]|uniref:hypothetical protein n=1 Tax=Kribbella sp. NPDC049227 TaxID=3364113 RepID=UPI0037213670
MTYMNKGRRRPDGLRPVVNAAVEPPDAVRIGRMTGAGGVGKVSSAVDRVLVSR